MAHHLGLRVHGAEEKEEGMQPSLVVLDDNKRLIWALGVEQKGVTESVVKYVAGILDQSGYQGKKLAFKPTKARDCCPEEGCGR